MNRRFQLCRVSCLLSRSSSFVSPLWLNQSLVLTVAWQWCDSYSSISSNTSLLPINPPLITQVFFFFFHLSIFAHSPESFTLLLIPLPFTNYFQPIIPVLPQYQSDLVFGGGRQGKPVTLTSKPQSTFKTDSSSSSWA